MLMLSDGILSHCVGVYTQILLVEQLLLSSPVKLPEAFYIILSCIVCSLLTVNVLEWWILNLSLS